MKAPARGVGLGFRYELASEMLEGGDRTSDPVRWVEIHPENYIGRGGLFARHLEQILDRWPVLTHGLTSCVGQAEPFDRGYLRQLRALVQRTGGAFHSEHLCFGGAVTPGGPVFAHDLLPLPFTEEAIATAVERIRELRGTLEIDIAVENTSYYAHPGGRSGMREIDFLLEVLERADCKLLLDVNNVFVNSVNHGFDPRAFLSAIPRERVVQLHVAGHFVRADGVIIDTHAEPVRAEVLALTAEVMRELPEVPVLLERDGNHPKLSELHAEVRALQEARGAA
jgi:uncharacterized protein